ncbi:class I SAM-dependent methyltransferase [Lacibacter sp.]|uniref:class I SAM-dependent methyltransferase n=1 Tax=Lacibacter sp. TaxID=1915409 RepID=UPI002B4B0A2C|nr:class I SAM-dependent methyltransferase [Lacibacter sp.]HLP36605.1 class I SAM-dependent methyltransferase [Lacibacter sp.]
MKLLQHIKYFLYIASNWGIRIGFFTLRQEIKGEKKYGINSTSANDLAEFQIKGNQLSHATEYMPVNYFTIEHVLDHLPENARQGTFLDIGCGKGRALCVAAAYGFTKLYGIDFAKQLIEKAEKNLSLTKKRFPSIHYELSWSDISTLEISKDVSTLFLFNPFDDVLMKNIIRKINSSLQQYPREFYVLYCSPRHEELFFADGYDVLYRIKKYNFLEGTILSKKKPQG